MREAKIKCGGCTKELPMSELTILSDEEHKEKYGCALCMGLVPPVEIVDKPFDSDGGFFVRSLAFGYGYNYKMRPLLIGRIAELESKLWLKSKQLSGVEEELEIYKRFAKSVSEESKGLEYNLGEL